MSDPEKAPETEAAAERGRVRPRPPERRLASLVRALVGAVSLAALTVAVIPSAPAFLATELNVAQGAAPLAIRILAATVALAGGVAVGLPLLVRALGLHRPYAVRPFDLRGRRALVIATSTGAHRGTGTRTGVWASELTAPYYAFLDAGMAVDVASIVGGPIPFEPSSLWWLFRADEDDRYLRDPELQARIDRSLAIADLDFTRYDIVYLAGGWGAAYDLGFSEVLGEKVTQASAAGCVLGAVCHGPLGFLKARKPDGTPLVEGRRLTAVTNKQLRELGIDMFLVAGVNIARHTPHHPERELRNAGALFESSRGLRDYLASHVVVDGDLVTGQNQNSGPEAAERMLELVEAKVSAALPGPGAQ